MTRYDGPRSLGDTLRSLAGRYRKVDLFVVDEIRARWVDIVGDTLATRCVPELVREGVLFVRVPSGAFAQRLSMQERTILDALGDLAERAPTSLRFVVESTPETSR